MISNLLLEKSLSGKGSKRINTRNSNKRKTDGNCAAAWANFKESYVVGPKKV
jgi:hypothetical protein